MAKAAALDRLGKVAEATVVLRQTELRRPESGRTFLLHGALLAWPGELKEAGQVLGAAQALGESAPDLLIQNFDQRRHTSCLAASGVLLERGLYFGVCGAQFRGGRPETLVDRAVKRHRIFEAPSSAREHSGQSEERMVPRSFPRPVAGKERGGRHTVNRRHKLFRSDVFGYAFEALLEPDQLASLMDAWRNHGLQSDGAIR